MTGLTGFIFLLDFFMTRKIRKTKEFTFCKNIILQNSLNQQFLKFDRISSNSELLFAVHKLSVATVFSDPY